MARLSVIGTGYLGVTHAACMASLGHEVIGLDVDPKRIAALSAGHVPFHEPGLQELLSDAISAGRLRFTNSWAEVAENADIHFVCVGTPQLPNSDAADRSQVFAAVRALAEQLTRPAVVVGKSTVPVGTATELSALITQHAPAAESVDLVWNPEFLREGFAVKDTLTPDRIVLGGPSAQAKQKVLEVYAPAIEAGTPVVQTDYATAELVKVAANAFLATKISFINAFAALCDATGADVTVLADAIGHDSRIGRRFLNAGVGFGGGCLPKDIRALRARANELGVGESFGFLHEVDAVNKGRRVEVVRLAETLLGELAQKRITVLGAAFKPDSDDIRDSPALDIARTLTAAGAKVVVHDPVALPAVIARGVQVQTQQDLPEALRDAELVIHLTEWPEYRELDPVTVGDLVADRKLIDGRNLLDRQEWVGAGWTVRYLGRPGS